LGSLGWNVDAFLQNGQCRMWVKRRNTLKEHMFSAVAPATDIAQ